MTVSQDEYLVTQYTQYSLESIEATANNSWKSSGWVLVNKQRTRFYRIMYDARNWKFPIDELLAESKFRIPVANRVQLIWDAPSSSIGCGSTTRHGCVFAINITMFHAEVESFLSLSLSFPFSV